MMMLGMPPLHQCRGRAYPKRAWGEAPKRAVLGFARSGQACGCWGRQSWCSRGLRRGTSKHGCPPSSAQARAHAGPEAGASAGASEPSAMQGARAQCPAAAAAGARGTGRAAHARGALPRVARIPGGIPRRGAPLVRRRAGQMALPFPRSVSPKASLAQAQEADPRPDAAAAVDLGIAAEEGERELALSTQIIHFRGSDFDPYTATSTPIYQTATFKQPSATEGGMYDYTRSGNPTRDALEKLLAHVEGADRAFAFTTGMTALTVAMRLVRNGEEILGCDDLYGGTDRLLSQVAPRAGVKVNRVDTTDLDAVAAALTDKTRLVMLESPTNPRQRISDVRAICELAHARGALVLVDNSILSPVLSRPLDLGVDIVMHSATKFISGHADVMGGVLAVRGEKLANDIYFLQNAEGTGLGPWDAWLIARGIKTMALRIERQQASAQRLAEFLTTHPRVISVLYAGLPSHPGHALHFSQARGAGSVFSFRTGSLAASKHVAENTKLASVSVSFGSVSTSISLPCFMSHASIPAHVREERGLQEDLIRVSVGIEDVEDLIADFQQALDTAP